MLNNGDNTSFAFTLVKADNISIGAIRFFILSSYMDKTNNYMKEVAYIFQSNSNIF
ncbi:hypothetical protein HMPREF9080_02398 [Cardiobacterium valvarum F0432]|uniref:Uncharacterized protein n=1 Tax=Cardiobacterium valvarum F0432 TaxID=797473 RepID=G9ZHZ0_9GAMM|nr:hypothetical protein HMPREF9080_02398 [Cardiobacterium valvarum F0432]